MTYMVTSNPKRISVASGLVHIIVPFIRKVDYMVSSLENFRKSSLIPPYSTMLDIAKLSQYQTW